MAAHLPTVDSKAVTLCNTLVCLLAGRCGSLIVCVYLMESSLLHLTVCVHTLLSPYRGPWPQSQCHSLPRGPSRELCPVSKDIHLHCWSIETLEWFWADFVCCIDRGWQLSDWLKHTSCNHISANIAGWKIHIWYLHTVLESSAIYTHCVWHCWCGLTMWVHVCLYVILCTVTASLFILHCNTAIDVVLLWRNLFSTFVYTCTCAEHDSRGFPILSPCPNEVVRMLAVGTLYVTKSNL